MHFNLTYAIDKLLQCYNMLYVYQGRPFNTKLNFSFLKFRTVLTQEVNTYINSKTNLCSRLTYFRAATTGRQYFKVHQVN